MSFYQLFVHSILHKDTDLEDSTVKMLKVPAFRRYLIAKYSDTRAVPLIKLLANGLIKTIQKPQRCLVEHKDYYIAVDMYTNTKYMCYRNLAMIDIDLYKMPVIGEQELFNYWQKITVEYSIVLKVFRSTGGLHLFLVDRKRNYRAKETLELMLQFKADFNYIIYCYLRGWSVRLSHKESEDKTKPRYTRLGYIGDTGLIDRYLDDICELHLEYSNKEIK